MTSPWITTSFSPAGVSFTAQAHANLFPRALLASLILRSGKYSRPTTCVTTFLPPRDDLVTTTFCLDSSTTLGLAVPPRLDFFFFFFPSSSSSSRSMSPIAAVTGSSTHIACFSSHGRHCSEFSEKYEQYSGGIEQTPQYNVVMPSSPSPFMSPRDPMLPSYTSFAGATDGGFPSSSSSSSSSPPSSSSSSSPSGSGPYFLTSALKRASSLPAYLARNVSTCGTFDGSYSS
mmetsp:Transcript_9482/g.22446  ORF Transcript_9482/g.22446 Transcript_9482/m.22446 type:complete len:231 (-) Transcript_9482:110-802(-)